MWLLLRVVMIIIPGIKFKFPQTPSVFLLEVSGTLLRVSFTWLWQHSSFSKLQSQTIHHSFQHTTSAELTRLSVSYTHLTLPTILRV